MGDANTVVDALPAAGRTTAPNPTVITIGKQP